MLRRLRAVIAAALTLLPVHVDESSAAEPYEIPAHWTSGSRFDFLVSNFDFRELAIAPDGCLWVAGKPFLLRAYRGDLWLSFFTDSDTQIFAIAPLSDQEAWVGGSLDRPSGGGEPTARMPPSTGVPWYPENTGVLWHYVGGTWRTVELPDLELQNWFVITLRFQSPDDGWAIVLESVSPSTGRDRLLSYDGTTWHLDRSLRSGERRWSINDLCYDAASGGWWAVGQALEREPDRRALTLFRKPTQEWREIPFPSISGPDPALTSVSCLPDGDVLVIGNSRHFHGGPEGVPILARYRDAWELISIPDHVQPYTVVDMSTPSRNDIWLFGSCVECAPHDRLFHVEGDQWREVALPQPPEGTSEKYDIRDIAFVSRDEGWAIGANHQGRLFHYQNGVWAVRSWNWHFWNERWFGLLGR